MESDDAKLVTRALRGDTESYGALVTRYQGAVYAAAYYYVGRYGSAEDVAQDAFLEGYRSLHKLKKPDRFAPWIKEIACRTAANWLRKNGKRIRNETPLPFRRTISIEDARDGPRETLERGERAEHVWSAIDSLPERYRLPVVLRYLQELSYNEIAKFTGETPEEIRGVLQRAGRQLRDVLADIEQREGQGKWHRASE